MSLVGSRRSRMRGACRSLVVLVVMAACSSNTIIGVPVDTRSQLVNATVGEEIDVTLANEGPGTYTSPPSMSSTALNFIEMVIVPPASPAGPWQRFRFRAAAKGESIVDFQRMLGDSLVSTVEDTVVVH